MKTITAIVLSVILFVSLALIPGVSSAQNVQQPADTYMDTGANTGNVQTPGATTTDSANDGFNPMWLLPLLAVPVAYFIYKAANKDANTRDYSSSSSVAGAKGGKATKYYDEDTRDE